MARVARVLYVAGSCGLCVGSLHGISSVSCKPAARCPWAPRQCTVYSQMCSTPTHTRATFERHATTTQCNASCIAQFAPCHRSVQCSLRDTLSGHLVVLRAQLRFIAEAALVRVHKVAEFPVMPTCGCLHAIQTSYVHHTLQNLRCAAVHRSAHTPLCALYETRRSGFSRRMPSCCAERAAPRVALCL